jgi:hypothetical protein
MRVENRWKLEVWLRMSTPRLQPGCTTSLIPQDILIEYFLKVKSLESQLPHTIVNVLFASTN